MIRPNVVLIVGDDMMIDMVERMPYLLSEPHGSWVTFPNSFLSMPLCSPSRATILTGLYSSHHQVPGNSSNDFAEEETIAVALSRVGYRCGMFGKYFNDYPEGHHGLDGWDEWAVFENRDYFNYTLNENGTPVAYGAATEDYSTDVLTNFAVDFVANRPEPFFCYLPYYAPHGTAVPAPRHDGFYEGVTPNRRPNHNPADISDKPQWLQDAYPDQYNTSQVAARDQVRRDGWETCLAMDEGIEAVVDALETRGVLERTVIIFLADNGEMLMEHRATKKGKPYEESIAALMRVRWPGVTPREEPGLVSNIDLAPTIAAIAGTTLPRSPDGMDLGPLIRGEVANWRSDVLLEHVVAFGLDCPSFSAVRTTTGKHVAYLDGTEESYDLATDPFEQSNQGGDAALAKRLARLERGTLPASA